MKSFPRKNVSRKRVVIGTTGIALVALLLAMAIAFQPFTRVTATHAAAPQDDWKPVPIVPQETLDAGFSPGGEGGQWIRSIKWSLADSSFLLMGTDVGGVYRSVDGGDHWQVAMVGWNARGGNTFAFDPKNGNRVLGVGSNGTDFDAGKKPHGIYLSTDKAASWKQVLPMAEGNDDRDSIAYDPSSYDSNLGYCTVAYFVSKSSGIYKTTDGGEHWSQIQTGYSGLLIAVHPTKGYVYLTSDQNPDYGTKYGFYKSTDGGSTFVNKAESYTYGVAVSPADPDKVWISRYDGVLVSNDAGETFQQTGGSGLQCCNQPWREITVSPKNSQYMSVWADMGNYNLDHYYSTDGGQHWNLSDMGNNIDNNFRKVRYNVLPYNKRPGIWAYSPGTDANVFSIGGDWITKSTDGGAHYTWHGNGYNAVFVATLNFSPHTANTMVISTKDYNTYYTHDAGKTWSLAPGVGFDFGGYQFGGFALDDDVMWTGDDPKIDSSGDPILKVSTDGGKTWSTKQYDGKDIVVATNSNKFELSSAADPTDHNIGFIGGWRTTDHGNSWSPMSGVDNVYTYNPTGSKELYGKKGNDIVKSTDHGATWSTVATVSGGFRELAYDQIHDRFWVSSEEKLKKVENGQVSTVDIPADQYGTTRANGVAVDPVDPNIIYVGNNRDLWTASNSVVRSTDGGTNWENLTVTTPLANGSVSGGPHEAWWVAVNPHTREPWFATNCFGVWKFTAPGAVTNPPPTTSSHGLKGEYYNTMNLGGSPVLTRVDGPVEFSWQLNSPGTGVNADQFSVRWTGQVEAPVSGNYTFTTVSDDGVRLWVNGQLVVDNWTDHSQTYNDSPSISLTAGQKYDIKMEYYENAWGAEATLKWSYTGQSQQTIPAGNLIPAS